MDAASDGGPPSIGIVLSTYNGERFLRDQMASILRQTETQWRLLVRDDGSGDSTVELLRTFAREDQRIAIIDDGGQNIGVTQSYSRLIQACKALKFEYLMFCDQDDIWQPDKIALTLGHMRREEDLHPHTPILVHTDLSVVDEGGRVLHPSMWAFARIDPALNQLSRLLVQNTVTGCTAMINRALIERLQPVPAEALLHDWWMALVATVTGHVSPMAMPTLEYRQHAGNVAGVRQAGHWSQWLKALFSLRSVAALHTLREKLVLQPAEQAGALAKAYSNQLTPAQRELLQSFAGISNLPWYSRRLLLARRRVLRQRPRHNLTLMLLV